MGSRVLTGRAVISKKDVVEDCQKISAFDLRKKGYFKGLDSEKAYEGAYMTVQYSLREENYIERIGFTRTPCNFGGQRTWLICPGCQKRIAVLYRRPWRPYFKCRSCHDLSYYLRQLRGSKYEGFWRILSTGRKHLDIKKGIGQKGPSKLERKQLRRIGDFEIKAQTILKTIRG